VRGDKGVKMPAECYEYATAGGHEESGFLKRGMMRIFADDCVKYACNVAHHAKKKSETIPAKRKGRAERSREKMNEQRVRMIVSNLNQSLLRPCLSAKFSSVLTEMPMAGRGARPSCGSESAEEGRYDINTQIKGR